MIYCCHDNITHHLLSLVHYNLIVAEVGSSRTKAIVHFISCIYLDGGTGLVRQREGERERESEKKENS